MHEHLAKSFGFSGLKNQLSKLGLDGIEMIEGFDSQICVCV